MQAEVKDAYWKLFDTEELTTGPGPRLVELAGHRITEMAGRYAPTYPAAAENPPRGRLAGTALLRLLLVGGLVLLVGDWFEPGGAVSSGDALEHGEVAHEVADGGVRNPV